MPSDKYDVGECPIHGLHLKRDNCKACNAAYMRAYLSNRRRFRPEAEMLERARKRAAAQRIEFSLTIDDIHIPFFCPALGIKLTTGQSRSDSSASLDRINPNAGYFPDNVRVISDRANKLKSRSNLDGLHYLAKFGKPGLRHEYGLVAQYLERELMLKALRRRAARSGRLADDWSNLIQFLERALSGKGYQSWEPVAAS